MSAPLRLEAEARSLNNDPGYCWDRWYPAKVVSVDDKRWNCTGDYDESDYVL
jgi:hypothetical protein